MHYIHILKNILSQTVLIFTGALSHELTMQEMMTSSVYAMTSISEAFPFVLLEAMENYLPIVAYECSGGS